MNRLNIPRSAGVVAAFVVALTLGFGTYAGAQTTPPSPLAITDCAGLLDPSIWVGFCTPVWKLPIGTAEFGFSTIGVTPIISYDLASQTLSLDATIQTTWFDQHGNSDATSSARFVIRAGVGANGQIIPGNHDACGDGIFADFCVLGTLTNPRVIFGGGGVPSTYSGPVLLRGKIEHIATKQNAVFANGANLDDFEFYINVSNSPAGPGTFYNDYYWTVNGQPAGFDHLALEAFGYNVGTTNFVNNNPFGAAFSEYYVSGYAGVTNAPLGFTFPGVCTAQISGSVTDYFSAGVVPGAAVSLKNAALGFSATLPAETGSYASAANLCAGSYNVSVLAPAGFTVYGADTVTGVAIGTGAVVGPNFKLYSSPLNTSSYTTFSQAAWGTKPKGQNAGQLITTYFGLLYPTGLEVGLPGTAGRSIIETTAAAIVDVLPQQGMALPLVWDVTDPIALAKKLNKARFLHHRFLGSLAGEVMALELNVRFSAFSLTKSGLGDLHIASGPFAGWKVSDLLAAGNKALGGGGLPSNLISTNLGSLLKNYDILEDSIEKINFNYSAGTVDKHFLMP